MKKHIRTIVILLSAMLLSGCAKPEKTASFEPFYRFDVSGPTAWKEPLKNVRYLRAKRIRQVYDYIQEMDGNYTVSWSEWISQKES